LGDERRRTRRDADNDRDPAMQVPLEIDNPASSKDLNEAVAIVQNRLFQLWAPFALPKAKPEM